MKKAAFISAITLFFVMLVSCDFAPEVIVPLEEGQFYAQNMKSNEYYIITADKLYDGDKCEIWAEQGSGITVKKAKEIAAEYDRVIRPLIVNAFSEKYFTYTFNGMEHSFDDMLDYANWLAGRDDGKLTILLLDIKDDYDGKTNYSYVAGYFFSGNLNKAGKISNYYSNGRDMIYVDTYPGLQLQPKQSYATFAHELQHLVNFVTGFWLNRSNSDLWINEGFSAIAEYLYMGENPKDKCEWLSDSRSTIKTGNNFFVWGNHKEENPYANLDDYATVYLFFRWLYLQADAALQPHLFRDIAHSSYANYNAVTDVAGQIDPDWEDWESLLRAWLTANYYPKNAVYGYKGDRYLQDIVKVAPIANTTIPLYPGEGVYSIIKGSYTTPSATHIRYEALAGETLLTFNANSDRYANPETGSLTGVVPPASSIVIENRQAGIMNRPYVIDARDVLGRYQEEPILLLPR